MNDSTTPPPPPASPTPTPAPPPSSPYEASDEFLKAFADVRQAFALQLAAMQDVIDDDANGVAPHVAERLRQHLCNLQDLYTGSVGLAGRGMTMMETLNNQILAVGTRAILQAREKVKAPPSAN